MLMPQGVFIGGLRPNGVQVGSFSSWGTVVPKGLLPKVPTSCYLCVTQPYVLIKEPILALLVWAPAIIIMDARAFLNFMIYNIETINIKK